MSYFVKKKKNTGESNDTGHIFCFEKKMESEISKYLRK